MKLSIAAVLVTCLLSVAAPATAQDLRLEPVEPEGAGFFAIGGSWLDIDELNDALGSAGYPTFGGGGLTLGGGGYGVHRGRLLLGGEGYAVISGEEAVAGRTVTYGGGYGLFNIGYMIAPTPTTRVYPLFGIGGGGASLRIGARATEDSFGDVLDNPGRTASLNRGSLLLSFGIGAEYRLRRDEHGLMFGVRAGYRAAPLTSAWRLDQNAIGGGPDSSLAGPFVLFMIGGAGPQ